MGEKNNSLARGLGDSLARAIDRYTNIKPCGGCKERQETLNRWIPYKKP